MSQKIPTWAIVVMIGMLGWVSNQLNDVVLHKKELSVKSLFVGGVVSGFVAYMIWNLMNAPDEIQGWVSFMLGASGWAGGRIMETASETISEVINNWIKNLKNGK